jgi:acetyl-CoA acetyltransferase family protein
VPHPKPYDRAEDPTRPDGEQTSWDTLLGLVAVYAPTLAVPYYRIVWGNPQEGTTVGRYFDRAWAKAIPEMPGAWTVSLGEATVLLRERAGVTREEQDAFAAHSHKAAAAAWDSGFFDDQVVRVPGVELRRDESIRPDTTEETLAGLKTVFRADGTVTAGNASPLNDGASAALLGSAAAARQLGRRPLARVAGWGAAANEPQFFGFAPVEAADRALQRTRFRWSDVGAVELNEAFAAQSLACIRAWDVDPAIVNRRGGAIAIRHPLGASGTRMLGTLARTLVETGERVGVAAICIGVGQGLAVVLENSAA